MVWGTAAVAVIAIVVEIRARTEGFASVSPQEAILLMNRGALAIDLRSAGEFADGHVPGARRMDGEQVLKAGELLKKHQGKSLIVCCNTGSLAAAAVRQLREQGFAQAVTLRGGLSAWRAEHLPVEKQAGGGT
ncbi:rhodanese domain-containing protein [mine drainage metagenome]|uniref:Rhodanese domain-containing protein n=1 Tax=mine drainage metagenome TaxID=410659 RepID=T1BGB3_9ZZZZ